jgi:phage baseplate assembly protein W
VIDREISVPFRLDGQGRVATMSDPVETVVQHLKTYLFTQPGERVMHPQFGSDTRDFIFENIDPLRMQLLAARLSDKLAADVPNVIFHGISAQEDSQQAAVRLTVQFSLAVGAGEGEVRSTTMTLEGGV